MKRVVGISMRVVEAVGYDEPRDAISHDWTRFLQKHECIPFPISNILCNVEQTLETMKVAAIILSNGNNVAPMNHAEENLGISDTALERDEIEYQLLDFAVKQSLPVFAACRGLHVVNAYFGGSILRDLTPVCCDPQAHVGLHEITLIEDRLSSKLGTKIVETNSFHLQAVTTETLAPALRPFAVSQEGIVEGLYHPNLPIWAVQWHPERIQSPQQLDQILIDSWLKKGSFCM